MRRHAAPCRWLWLGIASLLLAATGSACAEERPLWELGMGAGVLQLPHYRGAGQSHTWLLPVPYVVYRGKIFKADRDGARAVLYQSSSIDFDLSASASAPVRSKDNDARQGMEDLRSTVEFGPNMNWTLARDERRWKLDLRLPLRTAVTLQSPPKSIGWVSTPNLNLDLRVGAGWNVGVQAAAVFNNARYNEYFYGVSPDDATATRPAYSARGGFGGTTLTLALSRRFERTWFGAFARADNLSGAVFDDSPLVRRKQTWSAGVAFSYVFAASSSMVQVRD